MGRARVQPLVAAAPEVLVSVLFLIMLWLEIGVMRRLTWPSTSYLLGVVASLMTAWVVIKLSSTFIRNTAVAQTLALTVWLLAALNITGLLEPTLLALDSFAVTLGEFRISLLTVITGVLSATILLWAASALSRVLETRIKRMPDLSPSIQVLMGKLLVAAATKQVRVLSEPAPVWHLLGFGESSLDFVLRFWVRDPEKGAVNVKGQVLLAVWDALKEAGIEIPYPHRQILLREPVRVDTSIATAG